MKQLVLTIISFLFFSLSSIGQNHEWTKRIGSYGVDAGNKFSKDVNGNVYVMGTFEGTVDFDEGPGTVLLTSSDFVFDVFVAKYTSNGSLIWAKKVTNNVNISNRLDGIAFDVDLNGNVFITGAIRGSASFEGYPGLFTNGGMSSTKDIFVLKMNNIGTISWVKVIGGSDDDEVVDIEVDNASNLFIVGGGSGLCDFDPSGWTYTIPGGGTFLVEWDQNGNFVYARGIVGVVADIQLDALGNIYTTGSYGSFVDFDPGPGVCNLSCSGTINAYISKLKGNGDFVWAKGFGGDFITYSNGIELDGKNLYVTGGFRNTSDFDPGVGVNEITSNGSAADFYLSKFDTTGNFQWVRTGGASGFDVSYEITKDQSGNIFIGGTFENTIDIDPGANTFLLSSEGYYDAFISQFDSIGNFLWGKRIGSSEYDDLADLITDADGCVYALAGIKDTTTFTPATTTAIIAQGQLDELFARFRPRGVYGIIYNDYSADCVRDIGENGLEGRLAIINPGGIVVQTSNNGGWSADSLPAGNYTITYDTSGFWETTCSLTNTFTVSDPNRFLLAQDFGLITTHPCNRPEVSIIAPFLRRCFSNQIIYVDACNDFEATDMLNGAYVEVELDSLITPVSSSVAYTALGNNRYRFNVGNIGAGQCVHFDINTTVSCAANLQQTLCMEARLFPADSCVFDTVPATPFPGTTSCNLPWDHSSLSVDGYCANDTVYFTVTNTGSASNGNMLCYAPVRVYVDDVLTYTDSIQLAGGQTITYAYPGNGQTWVLQADQHPLHPGNSHPNAHVEACGDSTNWTPGLVNNLPLDDADPVVDIYCGVVSGSYDPNDKTGFPTGLGTNHEILPGQQLQYLIRFQNTGTDTAFTIVVRDTLDTDLNIFSVVPGAASHPYSFRMYGPRVLEWTFNNIMLPDSNVNEALSHGFATFRVDQQPNLLNGTTILNDADIYFDFNEPVITNQTLHTINSQINAFPVGLKEGINDEASLIKLYPNPAGNTITVVVSKEHTGSDYIIANQLGQLVLKGKLNGEHNAIDITSLAQGFYLVTVEGKNARQSMKLIKQ